jgi:hypothetical protein
MGHTKKNLPAWFKATQSLFLSIWPWQVVSFFLSFFLYEVTCLIQSYAIAVFVHLTLTGCLGLRASVQFWLLWLGAGGCYRENMGKGHYYKNQNVENQKEHQKICEPSLHRKYPLKWSLHQKSLRQKQSKTTYEIRLKNAIGKFDLLVSPLKSLKNVAAY